MITRCGRLSYEGPALFDEARVGESSRSRTVTSSVLNSELDEPRSYADSGLERKPPREAQTPADVGDAGPRG
jgi:hypothetical protein